VRLATVRTPSGLRAVRIDGSTAIEIDAPDIGALLALPDWERRAREADGPTHDAGALDYAPLVPKPDKFLCVGLNYRNHIEEMGHQAPEHPTLFAKFSGALIGARDDNVLPQVSTQVDWEAELAVVIGAPVRHAGVDAAWTAIAGYTVSNDVSMRDWQHRTSEWLQGKAFESSTPLGPELVTLDEVRGRPLEVVCEVDGEQVQKGSTSDLVFDPAALVSYASQIITLLPGDVISTGTPAGVGHARNPPRYLEDGAIVVTRIEAVGECRNRCRSEAGGPAR
jgi:acylpyruvate hydrolase